VYRHVVPEVFDAATAAAGLPTRSFNFGIGGMQGLETEFVLERVLALRPAKLRWVWIDPGDPAERTEAVNRTSERFTAWHDVPTTWRALDLWLGGERPGYGMRSWAGDHLPALARRGLSVGRGSDLLRARPVAPADPLGPGRDGFVALDGTSTGAIARRRAEFVKDVEGFRLKRSAVASRVGSVARELEPFERRFFRRVAERVERAGARPIFLVSPTLSFDGEYVVQAAAEGLVPVALSYADPRAHPDFYRVELRYDYGHLNREGARRFSERLARDFVALERERRPVRTGSR
jgi:hypothetical protein